jgi:hypothetical protein
MLKQDIDKIITENLPAIVGEQLNTELTRLYEIEQELSAVQESLAVQSRIAQELQIENEGLRDFKAAAIGKEASIAKQQREIEEEKKSLYEVRAKLEAEVYKAKLEASEANHTKLCQLMEIVFKNTSIRRSITDNATTSTPPSPANNWANTPAQTNYTQRNEIEEEF